MQCHESLARQWLEYQRDDARDHQYQQPSTALDFPNPSNRSSREVRPLVGRALGEPNMREAKCLQDLRLAMCQVRMTFRLAVNQLRQWRMFCQRVR